MSLISVVQLERWCDYVLSKLDRCREPHIDRRYLSWMHVNWMHVNDWSVVDLFGVLIQAWRPHVICTNGDRRSQQCWSSRLFLDADTPATRKTRALRTAATDEDCERQYETQPPVKTKLCIFENIFHKLINTLSTHLHALCSHIKRQSVVSFGFAGGLDLREQIHLRAAVGATAATLSVLRDVLQIPQHWRVLRIVAPVLPKGGGLVAGQDVGELVCVHLLHQVQGLAQLVGELAVAVVLCLLQLQLLNNMIVNYC